MADVIFATNCSDLITMTSNPEDWSSFTSKLRNFVHYMDLFMFFKIRFIPHSKNVCDDHLV